MRLSLWALPPAVQQGLASSWPSPGLVRHLLEAGGGRASAKPLVCARHGRVNPSSSPCDQRGQHDHYHPVLRSGTHSPARGSRRPSLHRSQPGELTTLTTVTTAQPGPSQGRKVLPSFWPASSSPSSFQSSPQRRHQATHTPDTCKLPPAPKPSQRLGLPVGIEISISRPHLATVTQQARAAGPGKWQV